MIYSIAICTGFAGFLVTIAKESFPVFKFSGSPKKVIDEASVAFASIFFAFSKAEDLVLAVASMLSTKKFLALQ
ncbi:hypothetical protein D3C72_1076130 [compost metagenome]